MSQKLWKKYMSQGGHRIKRILCCLMIVTTVIIGTAVFPIKAYADVGQCYSKFNTAGYVVTGNAATDMAAIAEKQLGKTRADFGYSIWGGWCAAFINDCAILAGQASAIPFVSGVSHDVEGLRRTVIERGGATVSNPQKGDLVFYRCTVCNSYPHVGLVIDSDNTIEGNVSDMCKQLTISNPYLHYTDAKGHEAGYQIVREYVRPNYNNNPRGYLDDYSGGVKSIYIRGWAQDPDASNQSLTIHVYIGGPAGTSGAELHVIQANKYRSDIGGNFGYEETITVNKTGSQPIYVYAIDALGGDGHNSCIGSATVTISNIVTPTAISINNDLSLIEGNSATLSVSYTPSDTTSDYKGVTWSSSNEAVATVNSSGRVTAVAGGTAVITATSTYNSRLSSSCAVTVTKAIPVPEITSVDVDEYNIHVVWNTSPLTDETDVRTYTVSLYNPYLLVSKKGLTDTSWDFKVPGANRYRVTVEAVNETNGAKSTTASQRFTVALVPNAEWQTISSLPEGVTEENCDIEYMHTYRTTAQSSPGSEWSQVPGSGNTTYINDGNVWETEFEQHESDTCVQVGSYYYHYCGTGYGIEHFEDAGNGYTTKHVAGSTDGSFKVTATQKDSCHDILQYQLMHTAGTWANQMALCNEGRSDWWYIMYQYQNRKAVTTYTWEKTTDWQSTKDSSAYYVTYRVRLKDTAAPQVNTLNVKSITPRDYTLACQVSDDVGIDKVQFLSWTEKETEANAAMQEIAVEDTPKEAEFTATVAISDHGNARDVNYYTKVIVYDARGNTTEYVPDEAMVYMPTLIHTPSRKLILPADLQEIEDEAFEGSIAFGEVVLPEGVKTIGTRAFAECGRLTLIYMPDSIEHIALNAFTDCSYVVFLCASDNAAAAFARENHIPYFTGE